MKKAGVEGLPVYDQVMQAAERPQVVVTSHAALVQAGVEGGMTAEEAETWVAAIPQEGSGCGGE